MNELEIVATKELENDSNNKSNHNTLEPLRLSAGLYSLKEHKKSIFAVTSKSYNCETYRALIVLLFWVIFGGLS